MCRNSNLTSKTCFGSLNFIRVVLRYFSSDLSNCMKGRVICKQARKKTIWRGWPHSEIEASKSQRHGLVFFVASIIVIIYSNKSISIRLYMNTWVFTVYRQDRQWCGFSTHAAPAGYIVHACCPSYIGIFYSIRLHSARMLPLLGAACVEKPHHWRSCLYYPGTPCIPICILCLQACITYNINTTYMWTLNLHFL